MSASPSLTIVRRMKTPVAKLYAAWVEPTLMTRWWGPDASPVLRAEADPRVGGRFRVVFQTMDGKVHDCRGEYREVEQDRRLQFTWEWVGREEPPSLVTILFRPLADGTELTFTHAQFRDTATRDDHRRGWNGAFDKLELVMAKEGIDHDSA